MASRKETLIRFRAGLLAVVKIPFRYRRRLNDANCKDFRVRWDEMVQESIEELPRWLACVCFAASIHRIQVDPSSLMQELGLQDDAINTPDLLAVAHRLGLDARIKPFRKVSWDSVSVPALIEWPGQRYQLLVRLDKKTAVIFDPETPRVPIFLSQKAIQEGRPVQLTELGVKTSAASARQPFGLGWMIAPLLEHRAIVAEILAASMAIQVFALAMPLFSQVIIDKVLMHRNLSTLHVLGVGMIFLIAFEAVFSVLRTRLLTQTANRLDALLGARVVAHLLRLPLRYFESQKIGNTISKVRELESIRQFITVSHCPVLSMSSSLPCFWR